MLKFKEGNYIFIEFRYWNAVLSYPNLIRAMHKLKKESRGQISEMLIFTHGARCIIVGNPQFE